MTATINPPSLFTRVATFVVKTLWMTVATLLVLFALIMSLLRYSLPYFNDHKDKLEQYIANQYEIDLDINELSASWKSDGPALILRGVNIKKGNNSPIDLYVGEVFLEVEFWPSLTSMSFQSDQVVLNNLKLEADLTQFQTGSGEFPIMDALESIFLEQLTNFIVADSQLNLVSGTTSDVINIRRLTWLNRLNRHQGVGEFSLESVKSSQASFILDLYGDVSSYNGTFYAQAVDVDLSSWINQFTGLNTQLISSKGNLKVWSAITDGVVKRIDGQLLPSTFTWNMQTDFENKVSANFAAVNTEDIWQFSVVDTTIKTEGREFTADFNGQYSSEDGLSMRLAEPVSLKSLRPLSGLYSLELSDKLALIDLNAQLNDLAMIFDESGTNILAKIDNLSWMEFDTIVGIDNASFDLYWHNNLGKLAFTSHDSTLSLTTFLDRNLPIKSLNVPIFIDLKSNVFEIEKASLVSDEIQLSLDAEYNFEQKFLSLTSSTDPIKLNQVPKFLPNRLMGPNTKKFLSRAFNGKGDIASSEILYHGLLDAFPFNDNAGVFQSRVSIENGDFLFSEQWPMLSKMDIELLFENKRLLMQASQGSLGDIQLKNIQADIPELKNNAQLTITADGEASSAQLTELMQGSALANSLGNLLANQLIISGDLLANLRLEIPLRSGAKVSALGKVFVDAPTFYLPSVDLTLTDAKGAVSFDNQNIQLSDFRANLWGQPLEINAQGMQQDDYIVDIDAEGKWDSAFIADKLGGDFSKYSSGDANLALDLTMKFNKNSFLYEGAVTSDLKNLALNLPAPFAKDSDTVLDFELLASGDNTASRIDISLGDIAYFDGALAHKEKRFNRAHLALGPTEFETRGVGFSISGTFDSVDGVKWFDFINTIASSEQKGGASFLGLPQRIFIDTQRLVFAEQVINDVDVTVRRLDRQWDIDVDSNEARGNLTLFDQWYSKGIVANFEYIKFKSSEGKSNQNVANDLFSEELVSAKSNYFSNLDPQNLPNVSITCKSCEFNDRSLGRISLEAQPNNDGLELTRLLVENEFGRIKSTGQWYKRNQDHYSFIAGSLDSSDFGRFLADLGTPNGIQDSSADMNFALTWKDSPFDAAFSNLDGEIDWQLSDGYLSDVSDKGSRLFTLLSLNSLVRKLSLDFRDVFAKGFFYDNMSGSVQITQGKADTRDTKIDGAAGEIEIYGFTDLENNDLNYNVSFTPNVTGNLPVLVYFFTVSPPSALAALAIDQVLTSAKVISNVNYSVTGTIDEPILIETGRESTEVELPTRRQVPVESESDSLFKPPTKDDLIDLEVKDAKSD